MEFNSGFKGLKCDVTQWLQAENLKGRGHLEEILVRGTEILKWIQKYTEW